jgi:hypothetical protein
MSFHWIILDPQSGQGVPLERFPFFLGGGLTADLRLMEAGLPETLAEVQPAGSHLLIQPRGSDLALADGTPHGGALKLAPGSEHGFLVQGQPILVFSTKTTACLDSCRPIRWAEAPQKEGNDAGPFWSTGDLRRSFQENPHQAAGKLYRVAGTRPCFNLNAWAAAETQAAKTAATEVVESYTGIKGRCPQCWMTFRPGEVMAIACHEDLRGDPVLGSAAMRRFLPRHFDEHGFPLDEMDCTCRDLACPHCRHQLPLDLFRLPFHIVSLVGIQRSGKSYYLAILARIISQIMARDFRVRWEDLDPTGNIPLNDLRNRLFAAPDAESAALEKTSLGGVMYTEVHRSGRVVAMPRPFTYRVTHPSGQQAAFVFYDNAGEHFMPGIAVEESPGALHVTEASAILFLFDPLVSTEFRRHLKPGADPQLELHEVPDIQDIVLDEMRVRFARARGHAARDNLAIPFGVIVGKCDAWIQLLGGSEVLRPVVQDGRLNRASMEHNSALTHQLLQEHCPEITARLNALSSQTLYFPVSSFGHTPLRTTRGVAPDPKKLQPWLAEVPVLWALDQLTPGLIPAD